MFRALVAFSFPMLLVSLLFNGLLRPSSSHVNVLVSAADGRARVLLVTAHPDDECLFFAPTVLSLQRTAPNVELYSLCLSVGDADGLGAIRRKELEGSLDILGVHQEKRWVLDHPELRDNISAFWEAEVVAEVVRPYVLDHNITMILTFDTQGISSHPNHVSLPNGVAHFISTSAFSASTPAPRLFSLITVPLIHKYIGPVAPLLAKLDIHLASWLARLETPTPPDLYHPMIPVAVSGVSEYETALRAMQQHTSQLAWFRWLYVSFSRYMWVNEWVEVIPPTSTGVDAPDPVVA